MAVETEFNFDKKDTDEYKLVGRGKNNERIDVMRVASEDQLDENGRRYAYDKSNDGEYKPVKPELLEDDVQAQLARESADLPLLDDVVYAKMYEQGGALVEGTVTDYETRTVKGEKEVYGNFKDAAGNKTKVPIDKLRLDVQAELGEQKNKKFLAEAKKLIEQSEGMDDETKRMVLDAYLGNIERAVNAKELIASDDSEPFDSYQIETLFDKLSKALKVFEDPSKKTSKEVMKNVPRSNGLRDAFTVLLDNEGTAAIFEQAIRDKYEKEPVEGAGVERPLGHLATAGAEVVSPSEAQPSTGETEKSPIEALREVQDKISELTKDVPTDDLRRLVQYGAAKTEQAMQLALRGISDEVRDNEELLSNYVDLASQRDKLRAELLKS